MSYPQELRELDTYIFNEYIPKQIYKMEDPKEMHVFVMRKVQETEKRWKN